MITVQFFQQQKPCVFCLAGSNAHKSNLIVSRRSMKKPKPKPSPVAMVKPQLRRTNLPEEDELLDIFLCGIKENKNARKSQKTSQSIYDQKQQRSNKARNLVNENELVKVSFSSRKLDPDRQSKSNKAIDGNESIEKNIDQRSSTDKIQETGVPHGVSNLTKNQLILFYILLWYQRERIRKIWVSFLSRNASE